jgi:hypothetical protein
MKNATLGVHIIMWNGTVPAISTRLESLLAIKQLSANVVAGKGLQ